MTEEPELAKFKLGGKYGPFFHVKRCKVCGNLAACETIDGELIVYAYCSKCLPVTVTFIFDSTKL